MRVKKGLTKLLIIKNLAPHEHEDTKHYNRIVEYKEESTRNSKIAFKE